MQISNVTSEDDKQLCRAPPLAIKNNSAVKLEAKHSQSWSHHVNTLLVIPH